MEGKRLLTKPQVMALLGIGRRMVDKMFATPGFPALKGEKFKTAYVFEPDLLAWIRKEWRK